MDSEDNYSDDDDFSSGETEEAALDSYSDDNDSDYDFSEDDDVDDSDGVVSCRLQRDYTVLKEVDICQRQEDDITRVSTVLSIPRLEASILLRHYNWSVTKVLDAWFEDENRVRNSLGLLEKPVFQFPNDTEHTCGICFESYSRDKVHSAACGHLYCSMCWTGYISTSINDGPGCLALRCPDPSCNAAVTQDMVNLVAFDEDKEKYSRYLLRCYIEDNMTTKWCPAPGCEHAINFSASGENYDVSCLCSYRFCWNCTEEAHRPVDCGTVKKWILKNCAESENVNWILANSKPCPKCQRPIEKNQGCMHMVCTPPCRFEFCWLCLEKWSQHGETTGGNYACNRYEEGKKQGVYDEIEQKRELAKKTLERYTHYYERWATNHSSRQKAIVDLHLMQTEQITKLSDLQCTTVSQLKFLTEAWLQIIECRRVLKWTYAYGYYIPEHAHAKRQFFEYLQGEAESGLERLHQCLEKELRKFLNDDSSKECLPEGLSKEFHNFRVRLDGLTSVTRNYFENLVRALENGLADVNSHVASSRIKGSKNSKRSKKGKGRKGKKTDQDTEHWSCELCTFANARSATTCQMCNNSR